MKTSETLRGQEFAENPRRLVSIELWQDPDDLDDDDDVEGEKRCRVVLEVPSDCDLGRQLEAFRKHERDKVTQALRNGQAPQGADFLEAFAAWLTQQGAQRLDVNSMKPEEGSEN